MAERRFPPSPPPRRAARTPASQSSVPGSRAAACGSDGLARPPTRPTTAPLSAHTGDPVARPWGGRCESSAERLAPTLIRVSGTCHLAHVGRAEYVNLQTLVPGPVTQFTN